MKTLNEIILENKYKNYISNIINEYLVLESQGIFDECENISDIVIEKILNNIKSGHNKFSIKEKQFKFDIYISDAFKELHASTNANKDLKAEVIGVYIPLSNEFNLFDLKEIIFHELTHWYTSEKMLTNSKDNFFLKNSIQKTNYILDDDEQFIKSILYRFNEHEQNAFNSMIKVEIDKIQSTDLNKIFMELYKSKYFWIIFVMKKIFNKQYYKNIFIENNIDNFPKYYRKYISDERTKDLTDKDIFYHFKNKVNKAYEKFIKNFKRMVKKYANIENFKNLKYKNETINPSKYIKIIEHIDEFTNWYKYNIDNANINEFYENI